MVLSIVIPVYNVEGYVKRCIESCLCQNVDAADYEIIIVNDGSTDSSLEIVNDLVKDCKNTSVISQVNQGLSAARNKGLSMAHGEYIWFVDSDDWIEQNCLKTIISELTDGIDLLQLQYLLAYDDNVKNRQGKNFVFDGIKNGRDVIKMGSLPTPAQFTIYKRSFLYNNQLTFCSGIYHEDAEFKPRVTYLADKIKTLNKVCYYYYQRTSGSIMSSFRLKNGLDLIEVVNRLFEFGLFVMPEYKPYLYAKCSDYFNILSDKYYLLEPEDRIQICRVLNTNRRVVECMINSNVFKYKLEGLAFMISPKFGFWFYKITHI